MKKPCMAAASNKDQRATIQNEITCIRPQSTIAAFSLVIVTSRPDEAAIVATLEQIELEPLSGPNAAELIRAVAQRAALQDDQVDGIVDRSEGVPLLLEELTRNAMEAAPRM